MAHDILTGRQTVRDWSIGAGASDLPKVARGYGPETFWKPDRMEAKVKEFMDKPKGLFSSEKPTRAEAIVMLAEYMKAHKIGPMDV